MKPTSTSNASTPRIALTVGEPAGIGPDLLAALAQSAWPAELVAVGDPELLRERAAALELPLQLEVFDPSREPQPHTPGSLRVLPVALAHPTRPGRLDPANAETVLETLRRATDGCLGGDFDAMVTAPVQKSVINDAGIAFSGHTEFLAARCGADKVVMMLAAPGLRVALATTHLPLRAVPDAISDASLSEVIRILNGSLKQQFGLDRPRILVLGLNPHAGEGGHLGREEIDIIIPCLERLRGGSGDSSESIDLTGPLPADTAFTPRHLEHCDAVLAMYHDQGLPVLKFQGFGEAVNITLGLPIIRTSVDHGTALDLAGTGKADPGSLKAALETAIDMTRRAR